MKKHLLKKQAAQFTALASTLAASTAAGQVVITNANDTLIDFHNGFYDIDLNQDGQGDFRIRQYIETGVSGNVNAILISPLGGNGHQVAGEFKTQFNYPFRFEVGDSLGLTQTQWNGTGLPFENGYMVYEIDGATYPNSNWVGPVNDGYLGLRLRVTAETFLFGWARVSIAPDNKSFVVHEFALEQTENVPILAGNNKVNLPAYGKPVAVTFIVMEDQVIINNPRQISSLNISLVDLRGNVVRHVQTDAPRESVSLQGLAKGLYLLKISHENGIQADKILVR
jgi:hypothetical protein